MTHICVSKLTIIGSDNGLSPGQRHVIIWTNAGISLIGPLGTNFNETSIQIHTFSFKKIYLKLSPETVSASVLHEFYLVNICSGNGLSPDGTKPFPEKNVYLIQGMRHSVIYT